MGDQLQPWGVQDHNQTDSWVSLVAEKGLALRLGSGWEVAQWGWEDCHGVRYRVGDLACVELQELVGEAGSEI